MKSKITKIVGRDDVSEEEVTLIQYSNVSFRARFVTKNILRLKPEYFRLLSDFNHEVYKEGMTYREDGSTLHEIVLFKSTE